MNVRYNLLAIIILLLSAIVACSPKSEPEQSPVVTESIEDSAAIEREAARRDSIRQVLEVTRIDYSADGKFALQLSAWRSIEKAETMANQWKERGFQSSFVIESGTEESGDIWYRVRIGNFADRTMAERAKSVLISEHGLDSWIIDLSTDPVAAESDPK